MNTPLVALITDFGRRDSYVAEVHAAIVRTVPSAKVIDVTHDIAPYDRAGTALVLERTLRTLPHGASLMVVVDPGVGGARARLAVHAQGCWCVGPDNGILPVRRGTPAWSITRLRPREGVTTFDAREVFGPAAALLAAGADPRLLGARHPNPLPWIMPEDATDDLVGEMRYARGVVIALDHYGNAVTNIKLPVLVDPTRAEVLEPEPFAGSLRSSYDRVPVGAPVALVGSSGRIELAVNAGASGLPPGTEVCVRWPA